jgi:hypothetical protein
VTTAKRPFPGRDVASDTADLPDGLSETFFAEGLDRPNQFEMPAKISLRAHWIFDPIDGNHAPQLASLQFSRFLVEMQLGTTVSLLRDFMGPSFAERELHVTYVAPNYAPKYLEMFECPVLFSHSRGSSDDLMQFDAGRISRPQWPVHRGCIVRAE